MVSLKAILTRLKSPSVVLSIASQIITILTMLKIDINPNAITGVVMATSTIFVTLGIMSNPTTQNKWYGDDIEFCENCKENTTHQKIGENMVCIVCGTPLSKENDLQNF